MQKLYVVTRSNLSPGAIVAQSCHAVSAFAVRFPEQHRTWHQQGQNLVVLAVQTEEQLGELMNSIAQAHAIDCVSFFEPDLGGALTAFAVSDRAARLLSSLPLALRAPRCAA